MKKICITGGIACGKSLVGAYLRETGMSVIDADDVCHELMRGGPLAEKIAAAFGRKVLDSSGGIDRRELGRLVFAEEPLRRRLNAIVHPEARAAIGLWLKALESACGRRGAAPKVAAALVPLVFEAGWEGDWDAIVCVAAPHSIQIERLKRKGLSRKDAAARVAAQMPLSEKMSRSDYVIFNAGPIAGLKSQAALVFRSVKQDASRD